MKKNYPKILSARVDFGPPAGDYTLHNEGISGKPFPSEGEAWAFREGVRVMNHFMFMGYDAQLALLKQLELDK